jgi:hypothetical protein
MKGLRPLTWCGHIASRLNSHQFHSLKPSMLATGKFGPNLLRLLHQSKH